MRGSLDYSLHVLILPAYDRCPMISHIVIKEFIMPDKKYNLPETFQNVVRSDREYGIFLLEGEQLIFFPA